MQDKIKIEMGLEQGSNDLIAFDEYLSTLKLFAPNSKAAKILENTNLGIEHYEKFQNEEMAIKRMNINFDN